MRLFKTKIFMIAIIFLTFFVSVTFASDVDTFIDETKAKVTVIKNTVSPHVVNKLTTYIALSSLGGGDIETSELGFMFGALYHIRDNFYFASDISYHDWDSSLLAVNIDTDLININFDLAYKVHNFNSNDIRDGIFVEAGFGSYWVSSKVLGVEVDDEDFGFNCGIKLKHDRFILGYRRHFVELYNNDFDCDQFYAGYAINF